MTAAGPVAAGRSRCAAVFKTYSWDDFVERQARRFAAAAVGCDVYISVDESNGSVGPIPFERVVRVTTADLVAFGLPNRTERGVLLWWCPDYVHYHFRHMHPDYDTYIFVEYDVVVSGGSIEAMVSQVQASGTDLVALPIEGPWFWSQFHHRTYEPAELHKALICFTAFSARALDRLHDRRREMAADGKAPYWPSAEAFIPTEIERAGFQSRSLGQFGDVSRFNWLPAQLESDLAESTGTRFQHPVLDERRYAATTIRTAPTVFHLLHPRSDMRRRLRRVPRSCYAPLLPRAVLTHLGLTIRQQVAVARLWLAS